MTYYSQNIENTKNNLSSQATANWSSSTLRSEESLNSFTLCFDEFFKNEEPKKLDPDVWGPHFWFFLHTIAYSYPTHPNEVTKKKYYDLIHNFPLFIPNSKMGDNFNEMLISYPVSPYLCSRDSFMRWVFFIHNKINYSLGKPEISYLESVDLYFKKYEPTPVKLHQMFNLKRKYIIIGIIFFCIAGSLFLWKTKSDNF